MARGQPKDLGDRQKPLTLTYRQLAFVDHYVTIWDGAKAARAAGYKGRDENMRRIAWENLQKAAIKEAIKRRVSLNAMTASEALARLADIARGNLGQYIVIDQDGKISFDHQRLMDDGKVHLLKSVSARPDGKLGRVEFYSALQALELILKAGGVFDDAVTINLPPFDPEVWKEQADARLKEVLDMPDPYDPDPGNPITDVERLPDKIGGQA